MSRSKDGSFSGLLDLRGPGESLGLGLGCGTAFSITKLAQLCNKTRQSLAFGDTATSTCRLPHRTRVSQDHPIQSVCSLFSHEWGWVMPNASIFAILVSTLWLARGRDTIGGPATEFRSVLCDSACTKINSGCWAKCTQDSSSNHARGS